MTRDEQRTAVCNNQIGGWMLTLDLCFFGLTLGFAEGARVAALFGPYLIFYIPQLLSEIGNEKRRNNLIIIIVAISFLQYILRLSINNIGGTMPYSFY
jgi:hypothetical protein